MRYDKPIYFQTVTPGAYDKTTGNYGEETVTEVQRFASVTDSGLETLRLVYGEIRQGSLIVRLPRPYLGEFDRLRIDGKKYAVDVAKLGRRVFIVSEVQ